MSSRTFPRVAAFGIAVVVLTGGLTACSSGADNVRGVAWAVDGGWTAQ